MVHDNDDRAHLPGRGQVPERDVEPLWPPEETDGAVTAPPWAAVPWPLPPADAPTPSAADVPGPPAPAVDLDLPFTLDQPSPAPAPAQPGPGSPVTAAAYPAPDPDPAAYPASQVAADPDPAAARTSPDPADMRTTADPEGTRTTARSADARTTAEADGEGAGNGRAVSPWAQPPQRATADSAPDLVPADGDTPGSGSDPARAVHADGAVSGRAPVAGTPLPPPDTAPVTGRAQVAGAVSPGTGEPAPEPPRLGPFPPSPGVPTPPSPYGNGYPQTGYQPQPGQPGWYPPPGWTPQAGPPQAGPPQAGTPQPGAPVPPQVPAPPVSGPAAPPPAYPEQGWTPQQAVPPTAEDFARRRQARPVDPVATMGVRAVVNKIGLVRLAPGQHEQEVKRDIEMVRRNFGGLRQVTVVNPKGGAGKTVAILLLAMTFGQKRGGYVLAWDNNETQGTLGMRAQQDFHARTVRDMLRDLAQFQGPHGRVGDLSQYVRSQGEGMFDVLASDESATGGEMLTAAAFAEIREVVSRFYKLIFVDTGNNVRAQNWQAAMDATDQLVVTMSARNDSAETAARMLDHLEQSGRQRLVRQAVTVVSMPPSRKEIDLPAIQAHFAARTRAVLLAPYERLIDTGEPLRYGQLSSATRDAWLKIAASVAEGL
ncbi:chromosome partitioning protein [Micromonospora sp. B006]|uniref:MinD/ParA family ATP-binding protein n=1 Tax=Micromonospora sp. B006 TaxID=2201999 RepID=UPI000E3097E6|nr:chromosome partitioning protein [Micromonospora sp. B006]